MLLNCHIGLRITDPVWVQRQKFTNNSYQTIDVCINSHQGFHRVDKRPSAEESNGMFLRLSCMNGIDSLRNSSANLFRSLLRHIQLGIGEFRLSSD